MNLKNRKFHKYFTLSFDDGVTQDLRLIGILKKYGMPCTFNLNTGLFGANWTWVADMVGKPGLSHLRFTEEQIRTGIYNGFDVEVHTLNHPSLAGNYGDNANAIIAEVGDDAKNIKELTGIEPVGMAYPGGRECDTSPFVIKTIVENTPVRFARLAVSQEHPEEFALPEQFMKWYPSAAVFDMEKCRALASDFIAAEPKDRDMLFYVWGHAYDLDCKDIWEDFEELVRLMAEDPGIICVSNAEFYGLFKDRIPSA
ncbi:MAG: polysaccharide deacetylase family protein [Clostridia bacterium]|nr:polysaccharide deacetylase family protein [Clostridia bacterium]